MQKARKWLTQFVQIPGILGTAGTVPATMLTRTGLRPQTMFGLADSPVALAAWMLDNDARSYDDIAAGVFRSRPGGRFHTRRGVRVW